MATETIVLARIHEGGAEARLEVDQDDAEIGTALDHTLIAVRCVNNLLRPVAVRVRRGNGQAFLDVAVPAGQTRTQNAGGPVTRVSHLPTLELRA